MYSVKPPISVPGNSVSNYNQSWVSNYIQSLVSNGSNFSGANIYTHGATVVANAYIGGVYSPTQNRIYFVPYGQGTPYNAVPGPGVSVDTQNWHYVDCNTGLIGTYLNPNTAIVNAYIGGAYSPTQNRIYFVPYAQAAPANALWHYIDCSTGTIGTYANPGNAVSGAYLGGVYSPTQNRIYFVPGSQSGSANPVWHYIDCNDGTVKTYANPGNTTDSAGYIGNVYSPTQNRVYFVPFFSVVNSTWNYLDMQSNAKTSKVMMANATYNHF